VSPEVNVTRRLGKSALEHTFIAVRVTSYDVDLSAGINPSVLGKMNDLGYEDHVFESGTRLEVRGVCTYPESWVGRESRISMYDDKPMNAGLRVKDFQVRDEHNIPKYRRNRGIQIPVYNFPQGLAVIERRRSDGIWAAWVPVDARTLANMLTLLGQNPPKYLSIHEMRVERRRWIRSIALQTTDPAAE
jgi:hypothetical protein